MAISLVAVIALLACALRAVLRERGSASLVLCLALSDTACLEFFDLGAITGLSPGFPWKGCALFSEALLPFLWILCSLTFAREGGTRQCGISARILSGCSLVLLLAPLLLPQAAFFYAPDFPGERILFLTNLGCYYYIAIMALLVFALINFESTMMNASPEAFWRVKYELFGHGAILAVLVFYYSHALLYRTLDMAYLPLRSTLFAVAASLMSYGRLHFRGPARIRISQSAAFKSVVFGVVALYLVLLGMLGVGMQYLGPFFQRSLTACVGFLAGLCLLVLLSSQRLKREVQVFLHKHFYPSKYDYRAQWLSLTERLGSFSSSEELLGSILSAYCDTFGVEGAVLFLYEEGCGWYTNASIRSLQGLIATIEPENLLVGYLKERRWVFNIRDDNPEILRENGPFLERHRISFVVPIFERDTLLGFVALGALVKPDERFRYEDFDLMKAMARQAALAILHQRLSEQLTKSRAVEAVGNLATFVVHDLKNQVAAISLILENAEQHLHNPEFQEDMMWSLGSTVQKMHRLIGRLKNLGESEMLRMRPVELLDLVQDSVRQVSGRVKVTGTRQMAVIDEVEMQKVVLNLVLNGIEASEGDAPILAEVGCTNAPFIRVTDRGCGMSPSFVRRELFTPFRSTKKQGLGIGLYQCRQIVEAHGGRIEVSSVEGKGTIFTVWLAAQDGGSLGGSSAAA